MIRVNRKLIVDVHWSNWHHVKLFQQRQQEWDVILEPEQGHPRSWNNSEGVREHDQMIQRQAQVQRSRCSEIKRMSPHVTDARQVFVEFIAVQCMRRVVVSRRIQCEVLVRDRIKHPVALCHQFRHRTQRP